MSIMIKSEEGTTIECFHNVNEKLTVCIEHEDTYPLVFEFDNEKDVDFFINELRELKLTVFNQKQTDDTTDTVKIIINGVVNPLIKPNLSGRVYNSICKLYKRYNVPEELHTIKDAYNFIGFLTTMRGISIKSVNELNYFFHQYGLCPYYPTTSHYIRKDKDVFLAKLEKLVK